MFSAVNFQKKKCITGEEWWLYDHDDAVLTINGALFAPFKCIYAMVCVCIGISFSNLLNQRVLDILDFSLTIMMRFSLITWLHDFFDIGNTINCNVYGKITKAK